jgi:hypothetical protein
MNRCTWTKLGTLTEQRQSYKFYCKSLFSWTEILSMVMVQNYVPTNAETICVEFCNFMQRHTFVKHLLSYD